MTGKNMLLIFRRQCGWLLKKSLVLVFKYLDMVFIGTSVFFAALTMVTTLFFKASKDIGKWRWNWRPARNRFRNCPPHPASFDEKLQGSGNQWRDAIHPRFFTWGRDWCRFSCGQGTYNWPKISFNIEAVFSKKLMPECHLSMQKLWRWKMV